jgi:hypothetical protein
MWDMPKVIDTKQQPIAPFRVARRMGCALVLMLGILASAQAQPLLRHALAEEGTGSWCSWCAYGAYTLDSMEHYLGDSLIVLSWHGPAGYEDPFWIPQIDTLATYVIADSYPWLSAGHQRYYSKIGAPLGFPNNWDSIVRAHARVAPAATLDIRNAVYLPEIQRIGLDVSIHPSRSLPTEDTCVYSLIVAVTEDSLIASQEQAATPGFPRATLKNFVHRNVVRTVAGSVLGDTIDLGTRQGAAVDFERHYSIPVDTIWSAVHCRVKVILIRQSRAIDSRWRFDTASEYVDAAQTSYLTALEPLSTSIVVTKPVEGDILYAGSTTTVSFTTDGSVTTGRSLQYSTNNGFDWQIFGNVNNANTYQWSVPNTLTHEGRVRIVDDSGMTGLSGVFSIVARGTVTSVTIAETSTVPGNTPETIHWTTEGEVGNKANIDISYDNKVTWYPIVSGLDVEGITSYPWRTPKFSTTGAVLRVSFSSGASGFSAPFDIVYSSVVHHDAPVPGCFVSPNPASAGVSVIGVEPGSSVIAYDALGRVVEFHYSPISATVLAADVRSLPDGVYHFLVKSSDHTQMVRFCVVH